MFQVVRRWIVKEDLLVKLVYMCLYLYDGRKKDIIIMCSDWISIPLGCVQFITSQLYCSGEGYLYSQGRGEWW